MVVDQQDLDARAVGEARPLEIRPDHVHDLPGCRDTLDNRID
jgi:hypothetical protein